MWSDKEGVRFNGEGKLWKAGLQSGVLEIEEQGELGLVRKYFVLEGYFRGLDFSV